MFFVTFPCGVLGQVCHLIVSISCPKVIKKISCSTQLITKFQLLTKTKIPTSKDVSCFKSLRCCFYHANKSKMPTIAGILTFLSRIKFVHSRVEYEKSFITSGRDRCPLTYFKRLKKVNEYDQEIPQSHTADQPRAP